MDRARLILPALLGAVALAIVLPGLDQHGLWFDEAYTARLAALDWPRLLAGAQRDIHPPGWPILTGLWMRLPLSAESALRMPAALSFATLVGLLAHRNVWGGVALLLYGPLLEQASQGRPYVPLALGLVVLHLLVERGCWRSGGLVLAAVASLHALGGVLGGAVVLAAATSQRARLQDVAWLLGSALALSGWWLPAFAISSTTYVRSPWYPSSSAGDWWIVTDGGGGAIAAVLLVVAAATDRNLRAVATAAAAALVLTGVELAGVGAEIRKTGIVLLPLLLAGTGSSGRMKLAAVASVAILGATSAQLPERPDLREAERAVAALGAGIPVVSVFASEAAWYIRTPAPLPSYREPVGIARRLSDVVATRGAACVVSIGLPDTFPPEATLPAGTSTLLVARVTGLDVRLVGTSNCTVRPTSGPWSPR